MKRILFLHQASSIGGGSYCLLNVVKALDRQRFEPLVALKDEGPLADELRKLGIKIVFFHQMAAVPYNKSLLSCGSIRAYLSLHYSQKPFSKLLREMKCDILYLNNMMLYPYLRVAKENGLKTVIHVREHWPLDEHKVQLSWARNVVYAYADKLIAINHYSANIFPQKEATIVYDWIDMESRYKPISLSELFKEDLLGKKVLLYTGGLSSSKGTDYVLNSFIHDVKGADYRLLILGVDNIPTLKGFVHSLKLLLEKFGYYYYGKRLRELLVADKRVKCIPSIYELSDIIAQSHCYVSYFRIPHANLALAENIILANPCIVADTEEAREYSDNGKYAMLVSPMNNQKVFASQLIYFLEHIEQWQQSVKEGVNVIKNMFSPEKNIAMLNNALHEL